MKEQTLDVRFKRHGMAHFKAHSGGDVPAWDICPVIEDCPVADFLESVGKDEFTLEVTFKEY